MIIQTRAIIFLLLKGKQTSNQRNIYSELKAKMSLFKQKEVLNAMLMASSAGRVTDRAMCSGTTRTY